MIRSARTHVKVRFGQGRRSCIVLCHVQFVAGDGGGCKLSVVLSVHIPETNVVQCVPEVQLFLRHRPTQLASYHLPQLPMETQWVIRIQAPSLRLIIQWWYF